MCVCASQPGHRATTRLAESNGDAIPAHTIWESVQRGVEKVCVLVYGILHICLCKCVCVFCVHVRGKRRLVLAVRGKKKFGFLKEASYCPCPRLLIYELVEEISHLSLFISFLHVILFFSPSHSLSVEFSFPQIFHRFQRLTREKENKGGMEERRKAARRELLSFSIW